MTLKRLILFSLFVARIHGFHLLPRKGVRNHFHVSKVLQNDVINEADTIRAEIEEMRQEAVRRLQTLNEQVKKQESTLISKGKIANGPPSNEDAITSVEKGVVAEDPEKTEERQQPQTFTPEPVKIENELKVISTATIPAVAQRDPLSLLDDTTWKIMLNIGKEPGTWMPESWGKSGERLLLNLVVDFSPDQLYEREEFLNSLGGAKVLKVMDNELTIGPTLTEDSRKVAVRDGGWRVAPGEGPAGTDLLRFYFEIEEKAQHKNCDVYCPKGRIYCTCGYFPRLGRPSHLKDAIRKEQDALSREYEKLSRENDEDGSIISLKKMSRSKRMMDIQMEARKLNEKMNNARVREPEKDLLRLSRDGAVGLTREGGVCCKVQKGLAIEYHILGRFGIAAMEHKDHEFHEEEETKLHP